MMEQTYLVGGAVRDQLLGLDVSERDWVVTGATPESLQKRGFRKVGSDFPVFIHPRTGEEYALARTERKRGHGYHGFTVEFQPDVTLEQDLERRDLTINAMARDADGRLIDPYGGQGDLQNRVLRHVSEAFREDPLRVLRVARFAARFHHLGFSVHPDTLALMRAICEAGELEYLVPERSWNEINRAMGEPHPSAFVSVLREANALAVLLPEVEALFGVPQSADYHPEIDTGAHLLLALDQAAAMGASSCVVLAVLLHDLGKAVTDPGLWPAHAGHEQAGLPLVDAVCKRFKASRAEHRLARQVSAWHLRCHGLLEARPAKVLKLLELLDAFRNGDVEAFVQACEADYRGRLGLAQRPYPQGNLLRAALEAAKSIRAADLDDAPKPGPAVGEALRRARIEAIEQLQVELDQEPGGTGS